MSDRESRACAACGNAYGPVRRDQKYCTRPECRGARGQRAAPVARAGGSQAAKLRKAAPGLSDDLLRAPGNRRNLSRLVVGRVSQR
jgi:hypothetical protein